MTTDGIIFVLGGGVTAIFLGGAYVLMRARFLNLSRGASRSDASSRNVVVLEAPPRAQSS
ncbi:MAG: hypothetical protein ACI8PZ_006573 [Myxococcota bacterium]|jgi:hypothetical protein